MILTEEETFNEIFFFFKPTGEQTRLTQSILTF